MSLCARREQLIERVRSDLVEQGHSALVGPPGIGKTFLSHEIARTFARVVKVDLVETPDLPLALGRAVDPHASTLSVPALLKRISQSGASLIVCDADDLESTDGAGFERALRETPVAHVLWIARRRPTWLDAAHVAPPLVTPETPTDWPSTSAGQLFLDALRRAGMADVPARDVATVHAAIQACDGVPLALAVTARLVGTFGAEALSRGAPGAIRRAAALDRAFASLVESLPRHALALATRLSLLRSRWTADVALERGDLEALEALGDAGLISSEPGRDGVRMRLLGPFADFVRPVGEEENAAHYDLVAARVSSLCQWAELAGETRLLSAEQSDFAALLAFDRERGDPRTLRIVGEAAAFFGLGAIGDELRRSVRATLDRNADAPPLPLARARLAWVALARSSAEPEPVERVVTSVLEIAEREGDLALQGRALRQLGIFRMLGNRMEEAATTLERALEALDEGGDDLHRGATLDFLAQAKARLGRHDEAAEHLQEAITLHRAHGNKRLLVYAQTGLANVLGAIGDTRRARLGSLQAMTAARELDDPVCEAYATVAHALALLVDGRDGEARALVERARALYEAAGHRNLVDYCDGLRGIAALLDGAVDEALPLLEIGAAGTQRPMALLCEAYLATIELCDGLTDRAQARVQRARRERLGSASPEPAVAVLFALVEQPSAPAAAPNAEKEPRDIEYRVAARWIERVRDSLPQEPAEPQTPPPRILVAPDGADFVVDGRRVALGGKPVLRRLLASLAAHRESSPGAAIDVLALVARVWPGERVIELAARARLHACVLRLRRLGMGDALQQFEGGYALDPSAVEIVPARP
ncbi:MAG: tetratricopeptide repeat protein [Myxococcales bacterium]|nr:tetratricopeptide repeat protein [Myxococcales bacterium]